MKYPVDMVLDTDTFNEIDDQYALAYILRNADKLNLVQVYAAPFLNEKSVGPEDGMEKSYHEVHKILELEGSRVGMPVFRGARHFLVDLNKDLEINKAEYAQIQYDRDNEAAKALVELAKKYSKEQPLYVVEIAAITNIATALLMAPEIAENLVIVWLGGTSLHRPGLDEFNHMQDKLAGRIVFESAAKFVQLPCMGIVEHFSISKPELELWLVGKTPLSDYLAKITVEEGDHIAKAKCWTKTIWDVTAIGYMLNEDDCFMQSKEMKREDCPHFATVGHTYVNPDMTYVYAINRDVLMEDLIEKMTQR